MPTSTIEKAQSELIQALKHLLEPPSDPCSQHKVIHDPIWGTCRFEPWEAMLLDTPLLQRLRGLKQTGLAYQTYPAAEHSRFQHTLGVTTAAARVLNSLKSRLHEDALSPRCRSEIENLNSLQSNFELSLNKLRLAALLHDISHSILSHSSERIYSMVEPFPQVMEDLKKSVGMGKKPGAAEIVVYLLVTSNEWTTFWKKLIDVLAKDPSNERSIPTLSDGDWKDIARWIIGYEPDTRKRFIADIISGPLDADKLDYISRDAYFAGIPVGHDYERFVSFACLDYQNGWWRLTLPVKGINALEQLIMARLVLTSYLYHHQKVRAAEGFFERTLAREFRQTNKFYGKDRIWDIFALQDADLYRRAEHEGHANFKKILYRQLPVRHLEFRHKDLANSKSDQSAWGIAKLLGWANDGNWDDYTCLLDIEDRIAKALSIDESEIILDIPRTPNYADLQNLELPGRSSETTVHARQSLVYRDWIDAYKAERSYLRLFGPRRVKCRDVFNAAKPILGELGLELQESNCVRPL